MEKRKILNNKWNCLFVLAILYCSESLMLTEMLSASVRAGIIIIFYAIYLLLNGKRLIFNKKKVIAFILLLLCILVCTIINGFNFTFDFWTVLMLFAAILICSSIRYFDFWSAFVDVMALLGFASAVIFILYQIIPRAFSIFPNYYWHSGILMKNCFICAVQVSAQYRRNFGFFREPGMFSLFLILALYFSLFKLELDLKKIIALLIALITTFSTSGYFCFIGLLLVFLHNAYSIQKKTRKRIIIVFILILLGTIVYMTNNPSVFHFLINKLTEINFDTSVSSNVGGSGYERWRSIVYAWNAILTNPIVGVGYVGFFRIFNSVIATATPLNWFGLYGIIYGVLMNFYYLKNAMIYSKKGNLNYISTIIMALVLLANIMSQNMVADPIILIFIFYQIN